MNEYQLIAAMLEDLNKRLEAVECDLMECDLKGRGSQGEKFRELKGRLDTINDATAKHLRKTLPR